MELNLDWRREQSARFADVSYEVRPLKVWAYQELMAFWEDRPRETRDGRVVTQVSAAESLKLMDVARRIFPEHVRSLTGITVRRDGAGQPVTPEDVCNESPLIELAGEILARLVALSGLAPGDEKN
jgi:hypothetical protein